MRRISFTVDSALLKELGERLVGRPHIALSELIKNSYDADATLVVLRFRENEIEVVDNGHGMNFDAFRDFWMRVGSHHKEATRQSPGLARALTGSKGVGRLAVQFLARELSLRTAPAPSGDSEIRAEVDWRMAVEAGDLTNAYARYETRRRTGAFAGDSPHGTSIRLTGLNHEWDAESFEALAREIWFLRPPFPSTAGARPDTFEVRLDTPYPDVHERFERQMAVIMELWEAKIRGQMLDSDEPPPSKRSVALTVEFRGSGKRRVTYGLSDCHLTMVAFEIRVFKLQHRQPKGVRVDAARQYLRDFGGVHIYDSGFRLPYYGPDTDWLRVEIDHSHRLSRSRLLPEEYQVPEGLNYLPTNSRLYGVVNVDTGLERARAAGAGNDARGEFLTIQVSRDRLVDNVAFQELQRIVRWALDYYAMSEATRALERAERKRGVESIKERSSKIERLLDDNKDFMPRSTYQSLRSEVAAIASSALAIEDVASRQAGLLGALATAGMSALAYEHEVSKQMALLERTVVRMTSLQTGDDDIDQVLAEISAALQAWVVRARRTRRLFSPLLDLAEQPKRQSLRARAVLGAIAEQVEPLLRGVTVDLSAVDPGLRLPSGTMAEWTALFQNLFVNASNALLDADQRRIVVESLIQTRRPAVLVLDTGVGVSLADADELFRPFVRRVRISPERQALGLGGTGLGLTIARMVATSLGCDIRFVEAREGFSTAVQISWEQN